jgi:hypothetical protein
LLVERENLSFDRIITTVLAKIGISVPQMFGHRWSSLNAMLEVHDIAIPDRIILRRFYDVSRSENLLENQEIDLNSPANLQVSNLE